MQIEIAFRRTIPGTLDFESLNCELWSSDFQRYAADWIRKFVDLLVGLRLEILLDVRWGRLIRRWNVGQIAAAKCRRDERKRRNVGCRFRLYEFRVTCARSLIGTPTSARLLYSVIYSGAFRDTYREYALRRRGAVVSLFLRARARRFLWRARSSLSTRRSWGFVSTRILEYVCAFSARMCSQRAAAPRDCAGSRTDPNLGQRENRDSLFRSPDSSLTENRV